MARAAKAKGRRAVPVNGPPRPSRTQEARWLDELREHLCAASDLAATSALLGWDQAVLMPAEGAPARGRQLARLASLVHEKTTDPEIGRLLDKLARWAGSLDPDSDDAALLRVARRDFERAIRVPTAYAVRAAEHGSASYQAWTLARPAADFATMRPYLEKSLDLSREYAGFFPGSAHVMDPLIGPEEGYTTGEIDALFAELRSGLVPLVRRIADAAPADDACLRKAYPVEGQLAFAREAAGWLGYDLARGRIDLSPHPFCTRFSRDDVRITTRAQERDLSDALFSVLHEVGHALYEMGIDPAIDGTPLGSGASAGVHESQSRLWENIVARSLPFWEFAYPHLQAAFPDQLRRVKLATFHRAINKVSRSLVRTDADELTYNLHIMIRFDLEKAMLEGRLAVKDLPSAWDARYGADLGVVAPSAKDGVLQDVHWFGGGIGGMFQGYTIGNILSAQLYEAALAADPSIGPGIGRGEFAALRDWLGKAIHRHGRKHTAPELIRRATGKPLTIAPYLRYLETKYADLYPG